MLLAEGPATNIFLSLKGEEYCLIFNGHQPVLPEGPPADIPVCRICKRHGFR
jgi:hypothetical protein